jgi:hypothetical protein
MQKNTAILQELESIGQLPSNIEIPLTGVPANYFENFNAQLYESIETTSFLDTLPKENPHTVPDNYFETPMRKVIASKSHIKLNWLKPLAIAASVALVVGTSFYFFKNDKKTNNNIAIENTKTLDTQFSATEAQHYVLENLDEFEPEQNEIVLEQEKPIKIESKDINKIPLNDVKEYIDEQDLNDMM